MTTASPSHTPQQDEQEKHKLSYIVKACENYKSELKDCRRFGARFNQYFLSGEFEDCSPFKKDFNNCKKWEASKDTQALEELIESEKARIRERLQGHYNNDVWEPRKEGLSEAEWSPPLPDHISQGYKSSFLQEKADAIQKGEEELGDVDQNIRNRSIISRDSASFCSIV